MLQGDEFHREQLAQMVDHAHPSMSIYHRTAAYPREGERARIEPLDNVGHWPLRWQDANGDFYGCAELYSDAVVRAVERGDITGVSTEIQWRIEPHASNMDLWLPDITLAEQGRKGGTSIVALIQPEHPNTAMRYLDSHALEQRATARLMASYDGKSTDLVDNPSININRELATCIAVILEKPPIDMASVPASTPVAPAAVPPAAAPAAAVAAVPAVAPPAPAAAPAAAAAEVKAHGAPDVSVDLNGDRVAKALDLLPKDIMAMLTDRLTKADLAFQSAQRYKRVADTLFGQHKAAVSALLHAESQLGGESSSAEEMAQDVKHIDDAKAMMIAGADDSMFTHLGYTEGRVAASTKHIASALKQNVAIAQATKRARVADDDDPIRRQNVDTVQKMLASSVRGDVTFHAPSAAAPVPAPASAAPTEQKYAPASSHYNASDYEAGMRLFRPEASHGDVQLSKHVADLLRNAPKPPVV